MKATVNGHLECLKYAHENGCEWHGVDTSHIVADNYWECDKIYNDDTKTRQLECLQYASENGCDCNEYVIVMNM